MTPYRAITMSIVLAALAQGLQGAVNVTASREYVDRKITAATNDLAKSMVSAPPDRITNATSVIKSDRQVQMRTSAQAEWTDDNLALASDMTNFVNSATNNLSSIRDAAGNRIDADRRVTIPNTNGVWQIEGNTLIWDNSRGKWWWDEGERGGSSATSIEKTDSGWKAIWYQWVGVWSEQASLTAEGGADATTLGFELPSEAVLTATRTFPATTDTLALSSDVAAATNGLPEAVAAKQAALPYPTNAIPAKVVEITDWRDVKHANGLSLPEYISKCIANAIGNVIANTSDNGTMIDHYQITQQDITDAVLDYTTNTANSVNSVQSP